MWKIPDAKPRPTPEPDPSCLKCHGTGKDDSLNVVWGGEDCEHEWGEEIDNPHRNRRTSVGGHLGADKEGGGRTTAREQTAGSFCSLCHAWRGQLGLEPTPDLYVQHIVEVFHEVRRVLRDDGTFWLNMGMSYDGRGNLVDMATTVRDALVGDGWYCKSPIVWSKPNPMPESVRKRPTMSHEMIWLMAKDSATGYFYDADAVRESSESGPSDIRTNPLAKASAFTHIGRKRSVGNPSGRNKRTVWEISTQPYPEAHFATFPEKLVEPCIKAGTPEKGACRVCGSPWERVVEAKPNPSKADFDPDSREWANTHQRTSNPQSSKSLHRNPGGVYREAETVGFRPTCDHDAESEPAIVLDLFCGSGSAGVVAVGLGRRFLGIDIKAEYLAMAERRLRKFPVRLDTFAEAA